MKKGLLHDCSVVQSCDRCLFELPPRPKAIPGHISFFVSNKDAGSFALQVPEDAESDDVKVLVQEKFGFRPDLQLWRCADGMLKEGQKIIDRVKKVPLFR